MDALPLSVNQDQLELMHDSIDRAMANLQDEHRMGNFPSGDSAKQEENLLTYGTQDYQEAEARVQAIKEQLKSQLDCSDTSSNTSKPVSLSLDSYQLKVLRMCIEGEINALNDQSKKQLLKSVMEQLPEFSLQEDAD